MANKPVKAPKADTTAHCYVIASIQIKV